MRVKTAWPIGVLLALTLLWAVAPAGAQEPDFDAPTTEGEIGYFSLLSGETLERGMWSFGAYYNNWDRVVTPITCVVAPLTDDWDYDHDRLSASIGYGVTDRLAISLMLPYESFDASDPNRVGVINGTKFMNDIDASGLGNLRIGAKWKLAENSSRDSALALSTYVELATGDDDESVATGDTGYGIGLNYSLHNWLFNLGYHDPGDGDGLPIGEEIVAGIGYLVPLTERLGWITEWTSYTATGSASPNEPDHVDLTTGLRWLFGDQNEWSFNLALRNNLTGWSEGTDELGGLVGITYRGRPEPPPPPPPAPEPPPAPAPPPPPPPPAPEPPPPAPPAPEPEPIEEVILFDSGSAHVTNIGKAQLDEIALLMKQDPDLEATVIGYSDSQGSASSNQRMSERRAEAVKSFLVTRHQIDPTRITVEGRGSADPVADNATAAGRAANRRVVIRVE